MYMWIYILRIYIYTYIYTRQWSGLGHILKPRSSMNQPPPLRIASVLKAYVTIAVGGGPWGPRGSSGDPLEITGGLQRSQAALGGPQGIPGGRPRGVPGGVLFDHGSLESWPSSILFQD